MPCLTGIITDIVSGGEGSELYRVGLPDVYCGMTIDAVVVAESLGALAPLTLRDATHPSRTAALVPSA